MNLCSEVLDHKVQLYILVSLQASMMYLSCEVNEYSLYIVVCMFPVQLSFVT